MRPPLRTSPTRNGVLCIFLSFFLSSSSSLPSLDGVLRPLALSLSSSSSLLSLDFSSALRLGGRAEIPNFCVETYNQDHHPQLDFSEVVKGGRETCGLWYKYYLLIKAKDGGVLKKFEVVVIVQAWRHYKHMFSLSPSTD
ncbi:hypothetical protein AMTRI_Chr09g38480 [Amborella trichopoda]